MKKKSLSILTLLASFSFLVGCAKSSNNGANSNSISQPTTSQVDSDTSPIKHEHKYDQEVTTSKYLKSAATCTVPAAYFYSCTCGEKGTESFTFGGTDASNHTGNKIWEHTENEHIQVWDCCFENASILEEHTFDENGVCTKCEYSHYDLTFTLNAEGTAYSVKAVNTEIVNALIPDNYNGIPVTSIEDKGFSKCTLLESIRIGKNVTSIGSNAFEGCSILDNVVLPDNVTTVGQDAFKECYGLVKATLSKNLTEIPQGMFYKANNLRRVEIPENSVFTKIGPAAFQHCNRLQSITIPASVTEINESNTFKNCYNLVEIKNLSSLEIKNDTDDNKNKYGELTKYAKNIYTATEGESILSTIGDWTFYTLKETDSTTQEVKEVKYLLNTVGMPKETMVTPTLEEVGSTYKFGYAVFQYDYVIKSLTISNGVVDFGNNQVFCYSSVENIYISDSVTSYSSSAFWVASSLTSIRLSNEATYINVGFLGHTTNLKSLIIPAKVSSIGKQAFNSAGVETIYYESSKEDWDKITKSSGNDPLTSATKYYYSEEEPAENKEQYWHYDSDGETPVLWKEVVA